MKNSNMPASPVSSEMCDNLSITKKPEVYHSGLTKREHLATEAMKSIRLECEDIAASWICKLLNIEESDYDFLTHFPEYVAKLSVIQADALLKELTK